MNFNKAMPLAVGFLLLCATSFGAAVPVDALWSGLRDNSNEPLASGKVYTYVAGTTTAKTTWTDSAKSTAAANPVILDAYGRATIYADGNYKFVIKTSADVTLATLDNLEYVSSVSPTDLAVTNLTANNATIASLTATFFVISDGTISSATISAATISGPEITSASSSNSVLFNASATNMTISSSTVVAGENNVATPTVSTDFANKGYIDGIFAGDVGGGVATPSSSTAAANKGYVDEQIDAVTASLSESVHLQISQSVAYVGSFTTVTVISGSGYQVATTTTITNSGASTGTFFVSCTPTLWVSGDSISTPKVYTGLLAGSSLIDGGYSMIPPASFTNSPSGTTTGSGYSKITLSGYVSVAASDTVTCSLYIQKTASSSIGVDYPQGGGLWKWHRTGNAQ